MVGRLGSSSPTFAAGLAAAAALIGLLAGIDARLGVAVAVGFAFVAVILSNLTLGFAFLAFAAFLDTLPTVGTLSIAKGIGVLLAISWIAVLANGQSPRSLLTDRPGVVYALVIFMAWGIISLAWSESRPDGLTSLVRYAPNLLLLPIAYTAVRRPEDIVTVLAAIVIGATLASVSGVLAPPDPSAADSGRATGTVGDANFLAASLVAGAAICCGFAVRQGNLLARLGAAAAGLLCVFGVLLSLSRGGLIALGVMLVAAILFGGRWRRSIVLVSALVVLAAVVYFSTFAPLPARERVTNVGGGGTGRVDLWTVGWRMVEAHPVRGVGVGQFQVSSVHYLLRPGSIARGDFIVDTPKVAHNTYLEVLSEEGVVGLALFLGIVFFSAGSMVVAAQRFKRNGDARSELLVRGLIVGLAGHLAALFFISENYSKLLWVLLALGPAVAAVAARPDGRDRASTTPAV